jgi:hydroxyacylglutathione hydrolase
MGQLSAIIVPVTLFQQNCTILFDAKTRQGVVVDPGGDVEKIAKALVANKITLEAVWITHGHLDHAGGAMEMKERFDVSIIGPHIADKFILDNIELSAAGYGAAGKMFNCTPDQFLVEGDVVSFGDHEFEVLHCPGHSPGHVVFFNKEAGFAHVGDVLFHGSIGRTDFKGGDHAALIASIKNKLLPLGDEIGFICGHGPGGKFGEERRTNPYLLA